MVNVFSYLLSYSFIVELRPHHDRSNRRAHKSQRQEGYSTWKLPSEAHIAICNMCNIELKYRPQRVVKKMSSLGGPTLKKKLLHEYTKIFLSSNLCKKTIFSFYNEWGPSCDKQTNNDKVMEKKEAFVCIRIYFSRIIYSSLKYLFRSSLC